MIRRGISSLSKLGLVMPLALSGCGGDDSVILDGGSSSSGDPGGTPSLAIATFEYRSALPVCSKSIQSQVYYVSSEDQLYYCDGSKLYELGLDCDPSWLTDTVAAKTSVCSNGGTVIRSGPDNNENDQLDTKEIKSTSTVCNGKDGKTGATGPRGSAGLDGHDGATGATGAQGTAGVQGPAGASCTVKDNGDDTKTLSCEDGTSVTIYDGSAGATGPAGPAGENGQNGTTGPRGVPGPAGSSCTVVANGDHSYDVTCPDGSHATVRDGQDGQDATLGPVLISIVPEPKGSNCANGGNRVDVGADVDDSGILESGEVTGRSYACAAPDTVAPVVLPIEWSSHDDTLIVGGLNTFSAVAFDSQGELSCTLDLVSGYIQLSTPMSIAAGTATGSFFINQDPWQVSGGTIKVTCADAAGNSTAVTRNWQGTHWANTTDLVVPELGAISPTSAQVNVPVTFSFDYSDPGGVIACDLVLMDDVDPGSFANYYYIHFPLHGETSGTITQTVAIASTTYFLPAGSGTLRADGNCHDAAGNYGFTSALITVTPASL